MHDENLAKKEELRLEEQRNDEKNDLIYGEF